MGIIDIQSRDGEIIVIGDGVISYNDTLYEYDQENIPDYLGYHLTKDFEEWFLQQDQRISLENIHDLSISTDGIFTFKKYDNSEDYEYIDEQAIIKNLLKDNTGKDNVNMLKSKIYELETKNGLKPTDDLSIIRLIF